MTEDHRPMFDKALDALAKVLDAKPRDSETKRAYFNALAEYRFESFLEAMNWLGGNFTPTSYNRFPVPAVISDRINSQVNQSITAGHRLEDLNAEESREYFRRRGYVIGDEAKRIIENQHYKKKGRWIEGDPDEIIPGRQSPRNGLLSYNPKEEINLTQFIEGLKRNEYPEFPPGDLGRERFLALFDPSQKQNPKTAKGG